MVHETKVLDAAYTLPEILEVLLERNIQETPSIENLLSIFFGKSVKTSIDWQSLYYIIQNYLPIKEDYKDTKDYYANVTIYLII